MGKITLPCPECGATVKVSKQMLGNWTTCRACGAMVWLPPAAAAYQQMRDMFDLEEADDNFTLIARDVAKIYLEMERNHAHRFKDGVSTVAAAGCLQALSYIGAGQVEASQVLRIAEEASAGGSEGARVLADFIVSLESLVFPFDSPALSASEVCEACMSQRCRIHEKVRKTKEGYRSDPVCESLVTFFMDSAEFRGIREDCGIIERPADPSKAQQDNIGALLKQQVEVLNSVARGYDEVAYSRAPSMTEKTPGATQEQFERFMQIVRTADADGEIIERAVLAGFGTHVIQVTLSDQWLCATYELRLRFAQQMWAVWASIHSRNPYIPKLRLIDRSGRKLGGSRFWAGPSVWVKKKSRPQANIAG